MRVRGERVRGERVRRGERGNKEKGRRRERERGESGMHMMVHVMLKYTYFNKYNMPTLIT